MAKKLNKEVPAAVELETPVVVKAIKAFNSDFKCNGFQYEVGKSYEITGELKICRNGFHACDQSPFDVWVFYPVVDEDGKLTRYAQTSHSGDIQSEKDDTHSKIASAKITIDAEISLPDFIRRAVAWVVDATKGKIPEDSGDSAQIGSSGDYAKIGSSGYYAQIGSSGDYAKIGSSGHYAKIGSSGYYAQIGSSGNYAQIGSSGDYAKIGSSGYSAQIGSSGYYAQIGSSGDYAKIGSSGDYAKIGSSGYYAQIGSSGNYAQIGSSGDYAKIGSSGHYAKIGSSGYYAQIGSSGNYAKIVSEGKDAVIATAGNGTRVSGSTGTWISVAEFNGGGKCIGFATGCIGEDGLEPGVFYIAKGGKLTKA